jgi:hypothetical protein
MRILNDDGGLPLRDITTYQFVLGVDPYVDVKGVVAIGERPDNLVE